MIGYKVDLIDEEEYHVYENIDDAFAIIKDCLNCNDIGKGIYIEICDLDDFKKEIEGI